MTRSGAYNETGDANSGGNETYAVGGDVIASDTGNGRRRRWERHRWRGGSERRRRDQRRCQGLQHRFVKQESEQKMEVEDNDKWLSFTFGLKKKRHSY